MPNADTSARALLQELDRKTLAYIPGVIDHINAEKALSYVVTGADTGFGLTHRKFPQIADISPGTVVEVGYAELTGPPQDWRPSEAQTLPGLCETFSGSLERLEGKEFAFIRTATDDVFVPPPLAKWFSAEQPREVSCLAIRRTNKNGKTSWRAVKIKK